MKTIESDRLILRAWTPDDAEDMYDYAKSPLVGPAASWKPHESIEETKAYLAQTIQDDDTWAIELKDEHKVIGSIGLHETAVDSVRELGYVLNPDFWGNGYMTEAVKAALRFAFEDLQLIAVRVCRSVNNARSRNVIQRCGFRYDGTLRRDRQCYDGTVRDTCYYSMTREEWESGASEKPAYAFVQNRACAYFPCHRTNDPEHFNCLFCYCPLYRMENCGGNPSYLSNGIKDCSNCTVPHFHYAHVIKKLTEGANK
jgi:putative acetyltransferase